MRLPESLPEWGIALQQISQHPDVPPDYPLSWLSSKLGISRTYAWQLLGNRAIPNQELAGRIIALRKALYPEVEKERLPVFISAAVLIENEKGDLLLVRQKGESPRWGPPAGGMIFGETPIETALRETEEEIGARPKLEGVIGIYTNLQKGIPRLGFVFKGYLLPGSAIITNDEEIEEARFFSLEEIQVLVESGELYRPDFNIPALTDWERGICYPVEVIKASF